jgi:hypothetical protein
MFNQGENARKENEIVVEARVLCGVKVWETYESWNLTGAIPTKFYKKMLGIPKCTENSSAYLELDRHRSRDRVITIVQYS